MNGYGQYRNIGIVVSGSERSVNRVAKLGFVEIVARVQICFRQIARGNKRYTDVALFDENTDFCVSRSHIAFCKLGIGFSRLGISSRNEHTVDLPLPARKHEFLHAGKHRQRIFVRGKHVSARADRTFELRFLDRLSVNEVGKSHSRKVRRRPYDVNVHGLGISRVVVIGNENAVIVVRTRLPEYSDGMRHYAV